MAGHEFASSVIVLARENDEIFEATAEEEAELLPALAEDDTFWLGTFYGDRVAIVAAPH